MFSAAAIRERMEAARQIAREQEEFDWSSDSYSNHNSLQREPPYLLFQVQHVETHYDRCLRMVREMRRACMACSMCELGRKGATKDGKIQRDPHVFSNQNPSDIIVVGQNPGWDELEACEPFVGQAGANFDKEIVKYGLSRQDFYICNVVRCWTAGNAVPSEKHCRRCEPFLNIEINLLRPKLVVTLGAVAFSRFCPNARFSDSLCDITFSEKFDVPVFAVYHPSPRNLSDLSRLKAFKEQIEIVCRLIKEIRAGRALPTI